jgi:hypothetical protein
MSPFFLHHHGPISCVHSKQWAHIPWYMCFSDLCPEREPRCMWECSGLIHWWILFTSRLRQKCRMLIDVYSCTCTVYIACTSWPSVAFSSRRFWNYIIHLLWMYLFFPCNLYVLLIWFIQVSVLTTYALWNKNRIVLIAMLSAPFVSPMPWPHPSSWLQRLWITQAMMPLLMVCIPTFPHYYSHIFTPLSQFFFFKKNRYCPLDHRPCVWHTLFAGGLNYCTYFHGYH